jgi:GTPase SAR1 family protein
MSPSTLSSKTTIPFQSNPFADGTARSPWSDSSTDVAAINRESFLLLRNGVRQIRMGNTPSSIIVTGEPGSGKTHLLSRLKRYLEEEPDAEKTWYVYIRCQVSGLALWRFLRTSLASDLLQAVNGDGTRRLEALVRAEPKRLERAKHIGLVRALESLAAGRHTLAAEAWLRGETLTEVDLTAIGIGIEKEDEERSRELEARLVVEAFLRFLSPTPLVICFDQVEAIETTPNDTVGYHALGQMVSALINGDHRNLLLISCIIAASEHKLEKFVNGADMDRWLQEKATLKPIEWTPALDLVRARLDSSATLQAVRAKHPNDPLWPLQEAPLRGLFTSTGRCLPRKLIQVCKTELAQLMGDAEDATSRQTLDEFLGSTYQRFLDQARLDIRKADREMILQSSLPWLLCHAELQVLGRAGSSFANLTYRNAAGRETNLMFCYTGGIQFSSRLRKATQEWKGGANLKILSDAGIQPRPGSRGIFYLDQLKSRGAIQLHPLPEALAALQAIRNLTATARAGELSLDGENVTEDECSQWALANLPPQLEALRHELIGLGEASSSGNETVDTNRDSLLALIHTHKILAADKAASELAIPSEEVAACARRHPLHFGFLEGPPAVVFEAVEGSQTEGPDA